MNSSRHSWTCAGLLVCIALLAMNAIEPQGADRSRAPVAAIDHTEFDFGEVAAGESHEHAFAVQNPGTQRLVLTPAGCNCRESSNRDAIVVAPGASAEVIVELDTTGASGPLRQIEHFTTSDPSRPHIDLVVTAQVTGGPPEVIAAATANP